MRKVLAKREGFFYVCITALRHFMKHTLRGLLFLCTAFVFQNSFASIDSLKNMLKQTLADTQRVKTLISIAKATRTENLDSSYKYATQAFELAKKCGDVKRKITAEMYQGLAKYFMGETDEALKLYFEALNEAEKIKFQIFIPQQLTNIGIAYEHQSKLNEAINIHNKALALFIIQNDDKGMSTSYSNIGGAYYRMKKYKEAILYFLKAKDIVEKYGDKKPLSGVYNNLGNVYSDMKDNTKALDYYFKSLELKKELNNKAGIAITLENIGSVYCESKDFPNAIKYCNMAVDICKEVGSDDLLKDTYFTLTACYEGQKEYQKAFEHLKLYSDLKDTIYNTESGQALAEMDVKFKSSEKDKELLLKDLKIKEQQSKQKQQKITVISLCAGLLLACVALFFILKGYRDKQKVHTLIAHQKELVEEKQKEIIDSIQYAKRIQNALLTSNQYISKVFPEHFVLYRPKDIVSGDFYWILQHNNETYIALADCTGHGVPGAFMSMLGINFLNEIIIEKNISSPAQILNTLRSEIITALNPEGSVDESKDGMDMVLCKFNQQTFVLTYAAANNSLYVYHKAVNNLKEYKPDKMPVGKQSDVLTNFTEHSIQLAKGDTVYCFTDGYADQFGGVKGKKFKYKQLEDILLTNNNASMQHQKETLEKAFDDWKNKLEQVDDVTVVGIKI